MDTMKNFIIGYGETLTSKVTVKSGGGDKKHPYSFAEARERLVRDLSIILEDIDSKPLVQCPNGEVVVKFIQHPSYLAKSYYPTSLFNKYDIKDVGSKSMRIKPRKWAVKKHPEKGLTSCIFVSGTRSKFEAMLNSIKNDVLPDNTKELIQSLEDVSSISSDEKIKYIDPAQDELKLEVVLHASEDDGYIRSSFEQYSNLLGGAVDWARSKTVGGLTFLPVTIKNGSEDELAEFSHLRALRSMPKLRFNRPEATRMAIKDTFSLPEFKELNNDFKVCIFDGGIGTEHVLGQWVTEHIPSDVTVGHPRLLAHGSEVCSTYLFGPYDGNNSQMDAPYTNVDIVRVLSADDTDPDLFDVLTRIESVLKTKEYKYVNLSLGPRLAIDDDDVHVWTSVIDKLLQDGHCFATVAIGNDGDLEGEYARIQPPSDMVNCFAVGASNSQGLDWKRASYSCIGPGRSPGVVKPDGVIFGGSDDELFKVYSPLTHSIVGTLGTSYAAPYALRVAAGIDSITEFALTPSTVKALMIHQADRDGKEQNEVGWGALPRTPEEVVECLDDEAIVVYQGELKKSQHLRVPIPLPEGIDCTWVHLKATFCFNAITDPEHPLHYTRSGLDIVFRGHEEKITGTATHADTKSFFSVGNLYETEEELREDAHKWETCISRTQRFKRSTLLKPVFDVKYHAREKGGDVQKELEPLKYSLIISIRAEGDPNTYNLVLQQNQTLQSVKVTNRIRL
ncbi:S8 family peptidase [Vibrio cholerae]|uniref:S8 family peptidase n=2 Tax=Vibrio TaxID=662 RepID=UPI000DE37DAB|nr:S8 family peptidase [Vibrio cholerae]RBM28578.1 peptidase S8 [Vibrio tarriae]EGQ8673209.1 S8 family serine peptidase [Vibrio cholerae]EJF1126634.1 S8 family peptidase [Vibrio cholerae]EJL6423558.1 S8 family peptidase [Vibrio cholerae]EJL7968227.1 S8 family peptidase [Vibrio cholerae]